MQKHDGWDFRGFQLMHLEAIAFLLCELYATGSLLDARRPSEVTFDLPQELLAQASGDVLATCVRHLSDIILKEDGPGRMREDLMVSGCRLPVLPVPCRRGWGCLCGVCFQHREQEKDVPSLMLTLLF